MAPKKEEKAPKKEAKKEESKEAKEVDLSVKPPKPDDAAFKKRTDEVSAEIDAKKADMKKLTDKISGRNEGKEAYDEQKQALYNSMNSVKSEQQALIAQKKALQDQKRNTEKEEREAKRQLSALEKDVAHLTEEGIDNEIKKIEYTMATRSMSLKEEKEYMQQIKKLKAQRPQAQKQQKEYEAMKAKVDSGAQVDHNATFADQLTQLEAAIKEKKSSHEDFYEQIQKLKQDRDSKMSGVSELIAKKKQLAEDVQELVANRNAIHEEKRAMQKTFNQWEQAERKKRQQKIEAERKEWEAKAEAERAKWELEQPNPYLNETTLLEQTLDYCKNLLPKSEEAKAEEKKEVNAPDGVRVLMSKKDRDTEMYFEATKKKSLKKKGGDKAKATAIKHTAETFAIFDQLKVKAPMTTEHIPALMDQLNGQLASYMEKVKVWEAERAAKLEAAKNAEADAQATTSTNADE
ncbi:unnamed protein product [Amoebophrya sp. A120]|nr:unnamed protein product [Amoebophrya sp. A120]|eukprot:GSA120T00012095001.1